MSRLFSHASGIIISTACGRLRPPRCSSSSTSSKLAESLNSGVQMGNSRARSPLPWPAPASEAEASSADSSRLCRVAIQLRLPRMVLISPLWAMYRYGCASGQDGNVFVENRLCTSPIALAKRSSARSG